MCKVSYKLSVVRRISKTNASFIRDVWVQPLLNATKLFWVNAKSFVDDDMAHKVTDVFQNAHLLAFNFKFAC